MEKETPKQYGDFMFSEFLLLYDQIPKGAGNNLFDSLSKIHVNEKGEEQIPDFLKNGDLEKYARKELLPATNKLVEIVFGEINKYQKIRDQIKNKWASEIAYAFPVSSLLEFNLLRGDQGQTIFSNFCISKARKYLSDALRFKYKREIKNEWRKKKKRITKKQTKDRQSIQKPCLKFGYGLRLDYSEDYPRDSFQDELTKQDIREFINLQKFNKKKAIKYGGQK